jgi:hypothetical protein
MNFLPRRTSVRLRDGVSQRAIAIPPECSFHLRPELPAHASLDRESLPFDW